MNAKFPPGLAMHLAGSVRAARRRYRKRLDRCQEKFSESAVHELRVEARRILALLDLLGALHFGDSLEKPARNFKRRLDAFDDLRDTQVQLRLLQPLWRDFPEARAFKSLLRRREEKLAARLVRKIGDAKYSRLNRRLKQLEKRLCRYAHPSRQTSAAPAPAILRAAFRRVAALRRRVRQNDAATIHRLRVAFKRFRYMSEVLQPLVPELTAARLDRMKNYQAAAGDLQDIEVLLARLARVVRDEEVKRGDIKNLQSELLRRRRRAINSFMVRIDELFEFQIGAGQASRPAGRRLKRGAAAAKTG